eukprot:765916-Hanusia_phi.AAC.2
MIRVSRRAAPGALGRPVSRRRAGPGPDSESRRLGRPARITVPVGSDHWRLIGHRLPRGPYSDGTGSRSVTGVLRYRDRTALSARIILAASPIPAITRVPYRKRPSPSEAQRLLAAAAARRTRDRRPLPLAGRPGLSDRSHELGVTVPSPRVPAGSRRTVLYRVGDWPFESFRTSPIVPELPAPDLIIKTAAAVTARCGDSQSPPPGRLRPGPEGRAFGRTEPGRAYGAAARPSLFGAKKQRSAPGVRKFFLW